MGLNLCFQFEIWSLKVKSLCLEVKTSKLQDVELKKEGQKCFKQRNLQVVSKLKQNQRQKKRKKEIVTGGCFDFQAGGKGIFEVAQKHPSLPTLKALIL